MVREAAGGTMLREISIRNFAVIDDVKIGFHKGFSVLSGETGAGKSIIIEAVNLLLGARASSDLVRAGSQAAELEAFFDIDPDCAAASVLADQAISASDGLMIRRTISSSGRSRIFINSRQATLELLKQVTAGLAGVASQHAHQGLLKEENHLDILDEFAGTTGLKEEVSKLYEQIVPMKKKAEELKQKLAMGLKDQEFLISQIDEINDAALLPDEDEILERKRRSLLNASRIFEAVNRSVHEIYDRENSIAGQLSFLSSEIEKSDPEDEELGTITQRISSVVFDLQDIAEELRLFSSSINLDPEALESVDQRLDLISRLKRKYGGTLEDVFRAYESMSDRLGSFDKIKNQIDELESEIRHLLDQIGKKAAELSEYRKKAGQQISVLAGKELKDLEMKRAEFSVRLWQLKTDSSSDISTPDGMKIGPSGIDRAGFFLRSNPGEDFKPLAKIASGGELSRIVLALKAVLSRTHSLETLIFDEVDAGIGGATSEKVGMKLKKLSESAQVICITHQAQIAKYADHQFRIFKEVEDGRTFTRIVPLEDEGSRISEIARMIGGETITEATLAHARELLGQASIS